MDKPVAIGIDIGGTKLVAAGLDAHGNVVSQQRRETPANDEDLLLGTITELIAQIGNDLPVGIGIAGLVTPDGVFRYGPNILVRDLPLRARLEEATSATVAVTNDASAAAFGEQRVGAGRGYRDTVLFTLGTGVGGGIVAGGQLLVGSQGFAGELGHVIVVEGGRACPCGNQGCIEAYTSGTSIGAITRERLADDPSIVSSLQALEYVGGRAVTQAAHEGDGFAQALLAEAGWWLGVAAASVVNALDPGIVLVGGGAAPPAAQWLVPAARAALAERLVGSPRREAPPFELAALGDDAGMVGAGLYALERARSAAVDA